MKISKELVKGSLALMVLGVLEEEEMYGYQIIGVIASRSQSVFEMKEGTLYPILHALEKEGYLTSYRAESESGRERKYYKITATGLLALKMRKEEWQTFSHAVDAVLAGGV